MEVAHNADYLNSNMNTMSNSASNGSTGITIDSANYSSTTRIPSAEPEIENSLLNGLNCLLGGKQHANKETRNNKESNS